MGKASERADYYVYAHTQEGKPFYIGKGCHKRAWSSHSRSKSWLEVVASGGFDVQMVAKGLTEEEALALEARLIDATDGLVNVALNGFPQSYAGRPPLPESKKRTIRKVALFTPDEWAEIEAHLDRHGVGINELMRDATLSAVRKDRTND